jgi:site-specific DNA-methyltransferase (adenine-specific)
MSNSISYSSSIQPLVKAIELKPYFSSHSAVLYLSDAIELMTMLPENSIDMIFADPPYNLSNGGFTVHAGRRVSVNKGEWDKSAGVATDFDFHIRWIEACHRLLKPGGTLWISGTYHSIYQCGYAVQLLGLKILNDIAWFKPNASPNLSGRYFTASHETLIWARKGDNTKHTFNYQAMKNGHHHLKDKLKNEGKQMRSVWSITTPNKEEKRFGKHPTQKPVELLDRIIEASTSSGDIIMDPFTGSSTTGVVAVGQGRQFIGVDLSKEYLDLSVKRLNSKQRDSL